MTAIAVAAMILFAGCTNTTPSPPVGPILADEPDYGTWLTGVSGYEGRTLDHRGHDELTIRVGTSGNMGYYNFERPAVAVSAGATVMWVWTGEGGAHNVVATDGSFASDLVDEEGYTFSHTFDEEGIYAYSCEPHESMGMKGVVAVLPDDSSTD